MSMFGPPGPPLTFLEKLCIFGTVVFFISMSILGMAVLAKALFFGG